MRDNLTQLLLEYFAAKDAFYPIKEKAIEAKIRALIGNGNISDSPTTKPLKVQTQATKTALSLSLTEPEAGGATTHLRLESNTAKPNSLIVTGSSHT